MTADLRTQLAEVLHEALCSRCYPSARTGFLFASADADKAIDALLPVLAAARAEGAAEALRDLLPRIDDPSLPGDYSTFGQGWNGALNTLHGEVSSRASLSPTVTRTTEENPK